MRSGSSPWKGDETRNYSRSLTQTLALSLSSIPRIYITILRYCTRLLQICILIEVFRTWITLATEVVRFRPSFSALLYPRKMSLG